MKVNFFKVWISNLRSGKFTKCKNLLEDGKGNCCALRAGYNFYNEKGNGDFYRLLELTGLTVGQLIGLLSKVVIMNDEEDLTFNQIADYLEKTYVS